MNAIWSDVPVTLPRQPVLSEFLLQAPMPPFLADEDYAKSNRADSDRALHWVIALLHHPDPNVVLSTFLFWQEHWGRYVQSEVKMPYRTLMFDSAADHLLSGREDVATAAAHFTWRGYSEDNFKGLMSILDDSGFADKPRAINRLRQQCPPEHLAAFRELIGENVSVRVTEPPRSSAQEQHRGGDQATTVIGQQVWMVENLNVDAYRNGDPIPQVQDPVAWKALSTGAWCFYANKIENGTTWGRLYNWYAVNDVRGLAPKGWHIPSDAEWRQLINALGEEPAMAIKSTSGWAESRNGTNRSRFSALPAGVRYEGGPFDCAGKFAYWWSSTEKGATDARHCYFNCWGSGVSVSEENKKYGQSVRCVKD